MPPPPQPLPPAVAGAVLRGNRAGPDPVLERLLAERAVFLGGEIDDEVANRVCAQLLLLATEDPERDIALCIDSPGGAATPGPAIHDTVQLIAPDVAT